MRLTCINRIHDLARRDERVVFVGSDLSPGLLSGMKEEFPDRHYMEGVAEANIIGLAAGLAMEGYMPYVNTIATFITRRCYEQVAIDVCLHDLPVRLIGNGGGVVYAPLGPTHLAVEDIAIMRALPNMTIVAPADAEEMTRVMDTTLDWPHPIYIRLAKGGDPVVTRAPDGFAIGKAIRLREAAGGRGAPVLLVGTGVGTTQALGAAERLEADGIPCHVLHMPTVKPLDVAALTGLAKGARLVVTVEEHTVIGGLGSAVTDALVERLDGAVPRIRRVGIPDAFVHDYGSQDHLLQSFGIKPEPIAALVRETLHPGG
ncbi:transketolase family protein [Azospirillum sp.]|uniref:transketolase family protein n=1 Tax=Azospirillum sp. TaxID=34012 RepID=UPI002D4BF893|nr:transketolase C-terminal domain-containing protein [Azospirillum sp.]HYD70490.1 transketolase C-terminal domain-containing protein [Azospirillum sp.]